MLPRVLELGRLEVHLPSVGGSASSVGLAADIRVLVLVAEVKAKVVDHVSGVLNDVGTLSEVAGGSLAAEDLKLGHVVGVGRGRQAREDILAGKEERACADREDCTLAGRVLFLKLGKVVDETERLGLLVQDLLRVAAEDDENVKLLEAVVGLLEGDLRADEDALLGKDLGLGAGDGDFESLGCCSAVSKV